MSKVSNSLNTTILYAAWSSNGTNDVDYKITAIPCTTATTTTWTNIGCGIRTAEEIKDFLNHPLERKTLSSESLKPLCG